MTTDSHDAFAARTRAEARSWLDDWRDRVSEDSADSFPASDPPSWSPLKVGAPRHEPRSTARTTEAPARLQ